MSRFSVYRDKANVASSTRCPCPAANTCAPKCAKKSVERGKALLELPSNVRIPQSSSLQYGASSSSAAHRIERGQPDYNSLAKREIKSIFLEEKVCFTRMPAQCCRKKTVSDIEHVSHCAINNHANKNSMRNAGGRNYYESAHSTVKGNHTGFASSTLKDDFSRNASKRTSSSSGTTNKAYVVSAGNSVDPSVDPKRWNSLGSTGKSLSRSHGFSVNHNEYYTIPMNHFTAADTLISERARSQRSPKLKKRAYTNRGISGYTTGGDEYVQDMLFHVLMIERKITLPVGFLKTFGPDQRTRARLVDWMIGLQEEIHVPDYELYLAVNLLDHVLARTPVPINMLQLVALATIWITNKYIGQDILKASDLLWHTNNAYATRQLLRMERDVLKILKCHIHYIEPSLCVDLFLCILGLKNAELARFTANYYLDCITLLADFSSTPVTVLAAAAITVAIKMYDSNMENMVLYYFGRNMSSQHNQKRQFAESQIYAQITLMRDENYMFRKAYHKNKAVKNKL